MLLFLFSCFSFILLSKSLSFKRHPSMEKDFRLLSAWVSDRILFSWLKNSIFNYGFYQILPKLPFITTKMRKNAKNVEEEDSRLSLLDLPELTLECILEKLSPSDLCIMGSVCSYLRDVCSRDQLWKKHMETKWGKLIGDDASREWQSYVDTKMAFSRSFHRSKPRANFEIYGGFWPFSWTRTDSGSSPREKRSKIRLDSIMSWYISLENGKSWFPAQVYNRENGHVGFMMSCYDAKLCYDSNTDTFQARYTPHGRLTVERNIKWDRLRKPPVETPSGGLYVSDCLHDLKPGDHIEVQWRRNKEFPYGWWYATTGHLETCNGDEKSCCCCSSDKVIMEFKQFKPGSSWRLVMLNRKNHRETGNETDGFYGGIRKLQNQDEILKWKRLWPTQIVG